MVSPERFNPPAQIILYANKVALTSLGEVVVTTIIEDRLIHESIGALFEHIWQTSLTDHQHYLKIITDEHA